MSCLDGMDLILDSEEWVLAGEEDGDGVEATHIPSAGLFRGYPEDGDGCTGDIPFIPTTEEER